MKKHVLLSIVVFGFTTLVYAQWQHIDTPEYYDPNSCSVQYKGSVASNNVVYWTYSANCPQGGMGQSFEYEIFSTSNYGLSWNSIIYTYAVTENAWIVDIGFISADTGYFIDVLGAYQNPHFYRTYNGLTTYHQCYYEGEIHAESVVMIDYDDIYLLDWDSKILHLENDTFQLIYDLPVSLHVFDDPKLVVTENKHLYIACKSYSEPNGTYLNDMILSSHDGGFSWDTSFISNIVNIYNIKFATDSLGFAVGNQGTILRTQDAGQNWAPIDADTENDLIAVDFMNEQIWMIGGFYETLLFSEDGGDSWIAIDPPSYHITGIKFPEKDETVFINLWWTVLSELTSVSEKKGEGNGYHIFPNPARNNITIETNNPEIKNSNVEFYNLYGKKVLNNTIVNNKETFDCSFLPPGIYLVKIVNQDKKYIQRLVIQ